jgi:hypothetical protein
MRRLPPAPDSVPSQRVEPQSLQITHGEAGWMPLGRHFAPFGCLMGCDTEIGSWAGGPPYIGGLPLAVVIVSQNDPLGNEREAHAVRLGVAGRAAATVGLCPGMMHGVFIWRWLGVEAGRRGGVALAVR